MKKLTDISQSAFTKAKQLYQELDDQLISKYDRSLPYQDSVDDRWKRAIKLGFGKESSIYNSSFVYGKVQVGAKTWIGPNTLLDGTGILKIGSTCSISAGVQIYTHNTVNWALTGGVEKYIYGSVAIGNCCYIGPNVIITAGVTLGSHSIVGANSFLKDSFETNSIVAGNPARLIGNVKIVNKKVVLEYF